MTTHESPLDVPDAAPCGSGRPVTRCRAGRLRLLLLALALAPLGAACASTARAPTPPTAGVVSATGTAVSAEATDTSAPGQPGATPGPVQPARVVVHGNPSRRVVALTFDAGADAGFTREILDTLRREGIRASFSVTGLWAEQHRDLLLAIAADGHMLINHSYDHASFTGLSTGKPPLTPGERALELSRTGTTVYHLTQRSTRPYFRPPYGDVDESVQRDAAAAGYGTIVMWTVDSLGWDHATGDEIVARCLAKAEPGAIYVMHVGSKSQDAAALPRVIAGLRAAGYGFGTVAEVLAGD
jgi:peptidoglycan/xylan/chitin deacetylase (PgdA/CDA1 family)